MNYKNNEKIINITEETEPLNPRSEDFCDTNITKISCTHRNYALGDEGLDPETELDELVVSTIEDAFDDDVNKTIANLMKLMQSDSFSKFTELKQYIDDIEGMKEYFDKYAYNDIEELMSDLYTSEKAYILRNIAVIKQISIYDHSGISIYLGESSGFDTSSIGYIYVTREDVEKHNGASKTEDIDWKKLANDIIESEFNDYKLFVDDSTTCFRVEDYDIKTGNEIDLMCIYAGSEEEALEKYVGETEVKTYELVDADINSIIDDIKENNRLQEVLGEDAPSRIKNHNEMLARELNKTDLPTELKTVMVNFMDEYLKSDQRATNAPVWLVKKLEMMYSDEEICEIDDVVGIIFNYGEAYVYKESERNELIKQFIDIAEQNNLTIETIDVLNNMDWSELLQHIEDVYCDNRGINEFEFKSQHYYTEWKYTGEVYLTEAQAKANVREDDITMIQVGSAWKDKNANALASYKYKVIKGDNNE